MKKRIIPLLLLALTLGLSACGGKGGEGYQAQVVQDLMDGGAFSEELEELDMDTAFALYGMEDMEPLKEGLMGGAVCRSAGATCEEGAVLIFRDEGQAKQALQALEDYVAAQIESNRDYRPAEIPKLEEARIDRRGNTVLLVVAADMQAAEKVLEQ